MPGRDGTGPRGMNDMTGRGAGRCARPGGLSQAGRGWGRGLGTGQGGGWGAGGGHGWRHRFFATGLAGWQRAWSGWTGAGVSGPSAQPELGTLRQEAAELERTLGELKSRIREIEQPEGSTTSSPGKDGE